MSYRTALAILPPRPERSKSKGKQKAVTRDSDLSDDETKDTHTEDPGSDEPPEDVPDVDLPPLTGPEAECAKARAILNGNIGACYVKLVRLQCLLYCALINWVRFRMITRKP